MYPNFLYLISFQYLIVKITKALKTPEENFAVQKVVQYVVNQNVLKHLEKIKNAAKEIQTEDKSVDLMGRWHLAGCLLKTLRFNYFNNFLV